MQDYRMQPDYLVLHGAMWLFEEAGIGFRIVHKKMDSQILLLMMKSSWVLQASQILFEMMPVD